MFKYRYQRQSLFPFELLPVYKCFGLAVPMNLSASPFLSIVRHFLLIFYMNFFPFSSSSVSLRRKPLLLDLEASLILYLTLSYPSSFSSIISFFLALIAIKERDRLLFLILSSTRDASSPFSSNTSFIFDIDLFFGCEVLFFFNLWSSLNACFFLLIYS